MGSPLSSRVLEPAERPAGLLLGVLALALPAPGRAEPAARLVQLVFQLPDLVLLVALVLGRLVRRLAGLAGHLFRVGDGLPSLLSRPRLLSRPGFRSGPRFRCGLRFPRGPGLRRSADFAGGLGPASRLRPVSHRPRLSLPRLPGRLSRLRAR